MDTLGALSNALRMPRRTNIFQQVVAIVHRHMASGATVEESAMVTPIRGGDPREVDVVVSSIVAGHPVMVGIEACRLNRRADVGWVERMKAKHDDLPLHKLVLYSRSGYTKSARAKAKEHGITAIGAEPLSPGQLEVAVLKGLRTIWPKTLSLTPDRARVWVRKPDGEVVWFKAPADLSLFLEDGREFGPDLRTAAMSKLRAHMAEIFEQIGLRDILESMERFFVLRWEPFSVKIDGVEHRLYARKEDVKPPELHRIEQIELTGRAVIEVQQVTLTHLRLGETQVAYGELTMTGRQGMIVASDSPSGGLITMHLAGPVESP